ncbi:MSMEG_0565 family glycosyltransferase [Xylophilus sp. GW821-FHT01B05]
MPERAAAPARPLRVALFTHSVNPRGGVVHTLELADALHRAGHKVTVLAPVAPGQRLFRTPQCALELVPVPAASADVAEMVATRIAGIVAHSAELLRHRWFDIFHAQDSISANALADLQMTGAVPGFVRTVHHLDRFDDERLAAWQQRGFCAAQQVLCVSRLWQSILRQQEGVPAELVANGVDLQRFQPRPEPADARTARRLGLRPGAPLVLAVGGIEERKNTLRLLEAFVRLRRQWPSAQLVIAGGVSLLDHGSYQQAFQAALAASGLAVGPGQDLVLTGAVPDEDMPALMRLADVLALPSLREGFGLVVLEALASGTPVAVSHMAPFTEYLDGAPVCWADPFDTASIADALRQAVALPPFAQPQVCRDFSWTASAERHADLYHQHLGITA